MGPIESKEYVKKASKSPQKKVDLSLLWDKYKEQIHKLIPMNIMSFQL